LGEIPLELDIRERSDAGLPVVATAPDTSYAARYRAIAEALKAQLEGEGVQRRAAPRIVIE
jgi:ATP-binding protein involved in chromosome partitioning